MTTKKTETHYISWTFSEHNEEGYSLHLTDWKPTENSSFKFIQEVELEPFDKSEIVKAGVVHVDNEITDLKFKISKLEDKKQQLLALTYQE